MISLGFRIVLVRRVAFHLVYTLSISSNAGIFFFTLALFGFSCLSSLGLFASERILFMRERYGNPLWTP